LLGGQCLGHASGSRRPGDSTAARLLLPADEPVWVVLRREGPFHVPKRLWLERPATLDSDEVALQGRARGRRYVFGVEQYFVPEGTATPAVSDLTVRLRVGPSGTARIEQVYVKGAAWP